MKNQKLTIDDLSKIVEKQLEEIIHLTIQLKSKEHLLPFYLSEEENDNLPIPRLEVRYFLQDDILVVRDMFNKIEATVLNAYEVTSGAANEYDDYLSFKFVGTSSQNGEFKNLMYETKLPGFVVYEKKSQQVDLQTDPDMPFVLTAKMKKNGDL